jgi:GrpB-like predicted nucleotidyltransferase (UPF0157 family)
MSETPTIPPDDEPPEEDIPEPHPKPDESPEEEPAEVEARAAGEEEVEPALGFDEFLAARAMKPAAAAMLRTWMQRQGKDSAGHYPLTQWEADYQEMLVGT